MEWCIHPTGLGVLEPWLSMGDFQNIVCSLVHKMTKQSINISILVSYQSLDSACIILWIILKVKWINIFLNFWATIKWKIVCNLWSDFWRQLENISSSLTWFQHCCFQVNVSSENSVSFQFKKCWIYFFVIFIYGLNYTSETEN